MGYGFGENIVSHRTHIHTHTHTHTCALIAGEIMSDPALSNFYCRRVRCGDASGSTDDRARGIGGGGDCCGDNIGGSINCGRDIAGGIGS